MFGDSVSFGNLHKHTYNEMIKFDAYNHNTPVCLLISFCSYQGGIFENAASLLGNSFTRVKQMNRTGSQNCRMMCYFILFVVVFFFIMYSLVGRVLR